MSANETVTVTLYGSSRRDNSPSGNPRFVLHTSQGDFRTESDAAVSYEVENITCGNRTGADATVRMTYTRRSRLVHGLAVIDPSDLPADSGSRTGDPVIPDGPDPDDEPVAEDGPEDDGCGCGHEECGAC